METQRGGSEGGAVALAPSIFREWIQCKKHLDDTQGGQMRRALFFLLVALTHATAPRAEERFQ